jgi:hypothetical protein
MMVSMVMAALEFLAAADVQPAGDEEDGGDAEVDELPHNRILGG